MSLNFVIQHTIPVSNDEWGGPHIIFHRWIPENGDTLLIRTTDNLTSRLWLDRSCISSLEKIDDDYLSRWVNITVSKVFVDVDVTDVTDELVQFIYNERDSFKEIHYGIQPDHQDYERLKIAYRELGEKVLQEALTTVNRLISFARNHKGQFWLHERAIELDRLRNQNNLFRSKVKIEHYDWIRWCPPGADSTTIILSDRDTSIHHEDWAQVQAFVSSTSRPDFVLELLANADLFIEEGRRRNAIVEAASALERGVARFANAPRIQELRANEVTRLSVFSLKSQVEHMGFSGTVGFLLPLLFPVEVLPTDILKGCQEAIEIRNNVIHQGQRDVDSNKIRWLVSAVREVCKILAVYTDLNH